MSFAGEVKKELAEKGKRLKGKKAVLRSAFLSSGSMSDPEKSYHFELVCESREQAEELRSLMADFGLDGKITDRKNHAIVYLKEGEQIADMLKLLGASRSLMEYENIRILKEMRGSVNRAVNCETANINKTVGAAVRQIEDIRLIEEKEGLSSLPGNLREMAEIRLTHPEATLAELGECFCPPIGKSGVNHRLRKLSERADKLRKIFPE